MFNISVVLIFLLKKRDLMRCYWKTEMIKKQLYPREISEAHQNTHKTALTKYAG